MSLHVLLQCSQCSQGKHLRRYLEYRTRMQKLGLKRTRHILQVRHAVMTRTGIRVLDHACMQHLRA